VFIAKTTKNSVGRRVVVKCTKRRVYIAGSMLNIIATEMSVISVIVISVRQMNIIKSALPKGCATMLIANGRHIPNIYTVGIGSVVLAEQEDAKRFAKRGAKCVRSVMMWK
jgi:hypothetical protein